MSKVVVFDGITQTEIVRDMTSEELTQKAIDEAAEQAAEQAKADLAAQKQAVLDRLGINIDEAKLLLS